MKPEIVGLEFAEVVCTVAVLDETVPICVEPLVVVSAKVPVNDFMDFMAVSSVVLCAAVSVIVFVEVPVDHDRPLIVR